MSDGERSARDTLVEEIRQLADEQDARWLLNMLRVRRIIDGLEWSERRVFFAYLVSGDVADGLFDFSAEDIKRAEAGVRDIAAENSLGENGTD